MQSRNTYFISNAQKSKGFVLPDDSGIQPPSDFQSPGSAAHIPRPDLYTCPTLLDLLQKIMRSKKPIKSPGAPGRRTGCKP